MMKSALMFSAVFLMTAAVPAFAQVSQTERDECLLASKNCVGQVDDIYKRIHKLDKEIKKGQRVYTPEEMNRLREKLRETQELLKSLEQPGH